jgi:hypothetical protein
MRPSLSGMGALSWRDQGMLATQPPGGERVESGSDSAVQVSPGIPSDVRQGSGRELSNAPLTALGRSNNIFVIAEDRLALQFRLPKKRVGGRRVG